MRLLRPISSWAPTSAVRWTITEWFITLALISFVIKNPICIPHLEKKQRIKRVTAAYIPTSCQLVHHDPNCWTCERPWPMNAAELHPACTQSHRFLLLDAVIWEHLHLKQKQQKLTLHLSAPQEAPSQPQEVAVPSSHDEKTSREWPPCFGFLIESIRTTTLKQVCSEKRCRSIKMTDYQLINLRKREFSLAFFPGNGYSWISSTFLLTFLKIQH